MDLLKLVLAVAFLCIDCQLIACLPEVNTCSWTFTARDAIGVICTFDQVYTTGTCFLAVTANRKFVYYDVGLPIYHNDIAKCTGTVKPQLGHNRIQGKLSPTSEWESNMQSAQEVDVFVELPEDPPVISVKVEGSDYTSMLIIMASVEEDVSVKCDISGGIPPVQRTRLQCDHPIKDTTGLSENTQSGQAVIMIFQMTEEMNGRSCHCSGHHATQQYFQQSSVMFSLQYPAEVTHFSVTQQDPKEGDQINFTCTANGNPEPRLKLFRMGDDGRGLSLKQITGSPLHYSVKLTCNMGNLYVCGAENSANKELSTQEINLEVKCRPECPQVLTVKAEYCDAITLQWTPGSDGGLTQTFTVLQYDVITPSSSGSGDDFLPVEIIRDSKEKMMTYNITGLTADTIYNFSLKVENSAGVRECPDLGVIARTKNQTNVPAPPECPLILRVSAEYSDVITLQWTPGSDGGLRQTFTVLQSVMDKPSSSGSRDDLLPVDTVRDSKEKLLTHNITGLTANTKYKFSLKVESSAGVRECPDLRVIASTKASKPTSPGKDNVFVFVLVGIVIAIISALAIIVCLLILWRRMTKSQTEETNMQGAIQDTTSNDVMQEVEAEEEIDDHDPIYAQVIKREDRKGAEGINAREELLPESVKDEAPASEPVYAKVVKKKDRKVAVNRHKNSHIVEGEPIYVNEIRLNQ